MMNDKLEQLQKYLEKMEQFNHVNTLLYWDMRTNTPKEDLQDTAMQLTLFFDGAVFHVDHRMN